MLFLQLAPFSTSRRRVRNPAPYSMGCCHWFLESQHSWPHRFRGAIRRSFCRASRTFTSGDAVTVSLPRVQKTEQISIETWGDLDFDPKILTCYTVGRTQKVGCATNPPKATVGPANVPSSAKFPRQ